MGLLGDITDKAEHGLQNVIENIDDALKPIWRKVRKLSTALLLDLKTLIDAELMRRAAMEAQD
jgi:hypothetical protein